MKNEGKGMQVTFPGALLLLFIGLKLGGVIHWSWWWVTSPIWLGFIVIFAGLFLVAALQARRS